MAATCSTDWAEIAARLAGGPLAALALGGRGGNNRLLRVEMADGRLFALKLYPRTAGDTRDRLGAEAAALSFLNQNDVAGVPVLIGVDRGAGAALLSWVEGGAVSAPGAAEIDQAITFAARLHGLRRRPGAADLPPASEACVSAAELLAQIAARHDRLAQVAPGHPGLGAVLADITRRTDAQRAAALAAPPLAGTDRTLSPADFGFHNSLAGPDGRLTFLDFEYFGWDDPVKLAAELPLHPAMSLDATLARRWRDGIGRVYEEVPGFGRRLAAFAPLFALRWALIVLNEFLPERWARRQAAGETDAIAARTRQLAKARALLTEVPDA